MRSGETVLVTAAAGGVGQFVVQLAKQAGNTVIATCGSEDKAQLLRRLGADRIVNYRRESLKEVLRKEYPKVSTPAGFGQSWDCARALLACAQNALARGGSAGCEHLSQVALQQARSKPLPERQHSCKRQSPQEQSLQHS